MAPAANRDLGLNRYEKKTENLGCSNVISPKILKGTGDKQCYRYRIVYAVTRRDPVHSESVCDTSQVILR